MYWSLAVYHGQDKDHALSITEHAVRNCHLMMNAQRGLGTAQPPRSEVLTVQHCFYSGDTL